MARVIAGMTNMNAAIAETGAVLMGKKTFEMADDPDSYVGNYEFQVPILVLTHHPPRVAPKQDEHLTFTFVTDGVGSAIAQAKAAAVHGRLAPPMVLTCGRCWIRTHVLFRRARVAKSSRSRATQRRAGPKPA